MDNYCITAKEEDKSFTDIYKKEKRRAAGLKRCNTSGKHFLWPFVVMHHICSCAPPLTDFIRLFSDKASSSFSPLPMSAAY